MFKFNSIILICIKPSSYSPLPVMLIG